MILLVVAAGAAYLYVDPSAIAFLSSQSTPPYTFTNYGNSTSTTMIATTVSTPPSAVQISVPYGGGENDDGATQYLPQDVVVVIGLNNTVTWTNQDLIPHNVISNTGAFYSGDLSTGQSYTFTFTQAGTYPFYCSYHPTMTGVVLVKNP